MSAYSFWKKIAYGFARLFYRVEFEGQENEPQGPYLLCANHLSFSDIITSGIGVRQQLFFMAKKELIAIPLLGAFFRSLGAFPVNRGAADLSSLRHAISLLKDGKSVAIFPQGTRRPGVEPSLTPTHHGAAMLCYRAQVPILPVYIDTKGFAPRIFRKIRVVYGAPISPQELGLAENTEHEHGDYEAATKLLFARICSLPRKYSPPAPQKSNEN